MPRCRALSFCCCRRFRYRIFLPPDDFIYDAFAALRRPMLMLDAHALILFERLLHHAAFA